MCKKGNACKQLLQLYKAKICQSCVCMSIFFWCEHFSFQRVNFKCHICVSSSIFYLNPLENKHFKHSFLIPWGNRVSFLRDLIIYEWPGVQDYTPLLTFYPAQMFLAKHPSMWGNYTSAQQSVSVVWPTEYLLLQWLCVCILLQEF